jgi:hypothetical protein|tara:strand:- start:3 stop:176 length:174 start_codon:yes stop_codon:yes gene_type:complete
MRGVKKWGIKVNNKWWVESNGKPAIYWTKESAKQDAADFNSMRKKGDSPYTVEEYKK